MHKKEEADFANEYWPQEAEHIRRTLLMPGTWLDDNVVLQLFFFMATRKRYSKKQVRIVDSQVLCSTLKGDHGRSAPHLQQALTGVPLVLLPLVCGTHWSLLIYRPDSDRWYHADSLRPYHTQLAHSTWRQLQERGIAQIGARPLKHLKVPHQREGWECGLYTLQYMLAAVEASMRARTNEQLFRASLLAHCQLACDENLTLFTQRLLEEV